MKKTTTPAILAVNDDILMEILCRLPVKSLLRFRRVSKTWLDSISSPHFVKLHRKRSTEANSKILFAAQDDTYTVDYQTHCYDPKALDFQLCYLWGIMGCCNGLVCLSDSQDHMSLWNPATQELVAIPSPPVEQVERLERTVAKGCEFYHCEVIVCTLGSGGEWRTVDYQYPPYGLSSISIWCHWSGEYPIPPNPYSLYHKIISFDFRSEEFRVVPWIESVMNTNSDITIGVLRGCLAVLVSSRDCNHLELDVWMMKDYGVKESVVKLFSIRKQPSDDIEYFLIEPLLLRENGEMILKAEGDLCIFDGIDHTLAATYNHYPFSGPVLYHINTAHIYAESLVSIKSILHPGRD